jgi:hypothetical protein
MALTLDARIARSSAGDRLVCTYTVENGGGDAVYLVDQLARPSDDGWTIDADAVIVRESARDGVLRLVRGYDAPEADVRVALVPAARRLDPGQRLTGRGETPLPLQVSHPQDTPRLPRAPASGVVVEVGYLDANVALSTVELAGGGNASLPRVADLHQHQRFVRSALLPLPER